MTRANLVSGRVAIAGFVITSAVASVSRGSVSGLWFGVALLDELKDLHRWRDLWLGRLQDGISAGSPPGREGLAKVAPVRVFARHHQPLALLALLAERLALGGEVTDPGGHLADLLVRGQGQRLAVDVAGGDRFSRVQRFDLQVPVA